MILLTVEHRLAECHNSSRETQKQCTVSVLAVYFAAARKPGAQSLTTEIKTTSSRRRNAVVVDDHNVQAIQHRLYSVERTLCTAEPVVTLPSRPSVHVVNGGINLIWLPNRPL